MNASNDSKVGAVRSYWNTHTLGLQYASDPTIEPGTPEFFAHIRPWMNPYKFPWIMQRIEREAALLRGRHLLEVGCGMGFDSLEFLKRGVRVTATDLTENAVRLARRHFEIEGVTAGRRARRECACTVVSGRDVRCRLGERRAARDRRHALGRSQEVRRVLKPGGRAIISHFYRRPSWMWTLHRLGSEPIEAHEEDPPVNEFYTDEEILGDVRWASRSSSASASTTARCPVAKRGVKAALYRWGFRPAYNLLPESLALRWAYKLSVTAIRR